MQAVHPDKGLTSKLHSMKSAWSQLMAAVLPFRAMTLATAPATALATAPALAFAVAGAAEAQPPVVVSIPKSNGNKNTITPNTNTPNKKRPGSSLLNTRAKRIAAIVVAALLLGELFFLTYNGLGGASGKTAAVNPSPAAVISSQLSHNRNGQIGEVGYDYALNLTNVGPYIKTVDTKKLAPLSNNYLAEIDNNGTKQVVLIDETAVGRVIAFNADWSAYLAGNGRAVFDDVKAGSRAEQLVKAYDGYQILVFRLAIGQTYTDGKNVYILAQPQYTAMKDGRWATVDDVFLYTLVRQENTLVISEIEQIKLPASKDTG